MRRMFGWLRSRWFISLLGLVLIGLLIWYVGPQFAFAGWEPWESRDARFLTILAVAAVWGLIRLVRFLKARAVSTKVIEAILGRVPEARSEGHPADQEVALLEQRLQEAVGTLKNSRETRWPGRQFIYQMPWYVLIGPPGSGKTTALTSSQLRFLVTDEKGQGKELRGVHGTRDCDWFFTDEAVLLDTAGRYVTQDSREEVDSGAWLGFLNLLKQYRKRRPINGVLVCVSLPDIVTQAEAQTQRESQAIRLRIRELHDRLGIRFPIYLLFTKCDLLAGFSEFFDDLGRDERQQVWGMTFPTDTGDTGFSDLFNEEFRLLEGRIDQRLTSRMEQERDAQRRAMIYGFPQQFASVQIAASRFINDTFEPTRYELPATLRGVYFTSGTQQGTPLDRLTASLAASFGLSRQNLPAFTGHGRSYFVSNLMREVVFKEAGLANTDAKEERRRVWLQRGALAGAVAVSGLVATAWGISYLNNKAAIQDVTRQAKQVDTMVGDVPGTASKLAATLPPLNGMRDMSGIEQPDDSFVSSVMQLGLDNRSALESEAMVGYRDLLRDLFLPRLILRLEHRMETTERTDELYASLRTYLMLASPQKFSADDVHAWLSQDLEVHDSATVNKQQREQLLQHLTLLFEHGPVESPIDQNAYAVEQARTKLAGMAMSDRVYLQIIENPAIWKGVRDFHPVDHAGNVFGYVFSTGGDQALKGVNRRFTLDGYLVFRDQIRDAVQRLAKENWILGEGMAGMASVAESQRLHDQVLARYFDEYKMQWDRFLSTLSVASMEGDINKAIEVLRIQSGEGSPLKKLLIAIERETTLERADDLAQKGTRVAKGLLDRIGDRAGDLWQTPVPVDASRDKTAVVSHPVDAQFVRLNNLVRSRDGTAVPIDDTLVLLTELTGYLKSVQGVQGPELVRKVKALSDSVVGRLQQHAERQPDYMRKWLEAIEWQVTRTLGGRALQFLNEEWRGAVLSPYQRGLRGRYPLSRGSERDASLGDFGDFFGPGGSIDRFFGEYLQDFLDTSGRIWQVPANSPIHISRETLTALKRAAVIRDAFFAESDKTPLVKFSMRPIAMDKGITDFAIDIDGQSMRFDHSATRSRALQWPGAETAGVVNLRLSPPSAQGPSAKTIEGPWALFRLLDASTIRRRSANQLDVVFDIDGRKVEYQLNADSSLNPFTLTDLGRFQCPETL
jgi:type VI secretion system protein ImpL